MALRAPEGEGGAAAAAAAAADAAATKPERPEALGANFDAYWNDEKGVDLAKLTTDFTDLANFRETNAEALKQLAERQAKVPANPDDYSTQLPDDFEKPEGFDFVIDKDDPLLAEARQWAKDRGLTVDEFRQLIAMRAKIELAAQQDETKRVEEAIAEEKKKLGDPATAQKRIDAVFDYLDKHAGGETSLRGAIWTAKQLEEVESLIKAAQGAGGSGFNGGGRTGEEPGDELTEAEYQALSPSDQINYRRGLLKPKRKAAA